MPKLSGPRITTHTLPSPAINVEDLLYPRCPPSIVSGLDRGIICVKSTTLSGLLIMALDRTGDEMKMDTSNLFREEVVTDRKVGTIRILTPIKSDGTPDDSRKRIHVVVLHCSRHEFDVG